MRSRHRILVAVTLLAIASGLHSQSVVFTTDTLIDDTNTTYEGYAVTVRGCVLTVNGAHAFQSLVVERSASNQAGVVTHGPVFDSNGVHGFVLTIAGDVTIQGASGSLVASRIDASGRGYGQDQGPGRSPPHGAGSGGASHAGVGGTSYSDGLGGATYGMLDAPDRLGSGAGNTGGWGLGGSGGGSVKIVAGGTLQCDGSVLALGVPGTGRGGSGSGGSIHLKAATLTGQGVIDASGGAAAELAYGGGGGGGRIALEATTLAFGGVVQAFGGPGYERGGAGTIYTKTTSQAYGRARIDNGGNAGARTELRVAHWPSALQFHVEIARRALVHPYDPLTLRSLSLTDNAVMSHDAVQKLFSIVVLENATIDASSAIDVDGRGYPQDQGPGRSPPNGVGSGGGGHGGRGGVAFNGGPGGPCNDLVAAPVDFGSGAGNTGGWGIGGTGGGAVRLDVFGTLTVEGRISARGVPGTGRGGAGAGGSIWIQAASLAGGGLLTADGGDASEVIYGGGGGGGRIALHMLSDAFQGVVSTAGGAGSQAGGAGTVWRKLFANAYGLLRIDNRDQSGAVTELRAAFLPLDAAADVELARAALAHPYDPLIFRSLKLMQAAALSHDARTKIFEVYVLGDAAIDATSAIDVDGKGYPQDQGPGASPPHGAGSGGAAHGGRGGFSYTDGPSGNCYDSITAPSELGSGGGNTGGWGDGGTGGGAVRFDVVGTLTLDGRISARGVSGTSHGGAGSGGSVYINAGTLKGQGVIRADGGDADVAYGGGGGGGRIAVYLATDMFSGSIRAGGGAGWQRGGAGTVFTKLSAAAAGTARIDNLGQAGGITELRGAFWPPQSTFHLQLAGKALAHPYEPLTFTSLNMTSGATLSHDAVANVFDLAFVENATIDATSTIDADGRGYPQDQGIGASPPHGAGSGGAGHGGPGGASYNSGPGGPVYGSRLAPTWLGSGAGNTGGWGTGGTGGGAIKLQVGGQLTLDGTIGVRGVAGTDRAGAGSGGSVYLTTGTFAGQGTISADGGDASTLLYGGGGGGGRIAVYWTSANPFAGTLRANGGAGFARGGDGTIVVQQGVGIDWNLVRNGDFETGVLAPWTVSGGGQGAAVARADVTGLGETWAFGVAADTTPLVLAQKVVLAAGQRFLVQADLAGINTGPATEPDAGRWEVRLNDQVIDQGQLGSVLPQGAVRRHICFVVVAATSGAHTLDLRLWRSAAAGAVRTYVDNARIEVAVPPSVCVREARVIGTNIAYHVLGTANAPFMTYLSPLILGGGIDVPGFDGVLKLSPAILIPFFSGVMDGNGAWSLGFTLPNTPSLIGVPIYYQGLEVQPGPRGSLGTLHFYPLIGT